MASNTTTGIDVKVLCWKGRELHQYCLPERMVRGVYAHGKEERYSVRCAVQCGFKPYFELRVEFTVEKQDSEKRTIGSSAAHPRGGAGITYSQTTCIYFVCSLRAEVREVSWTTRGNHRIETHADH